MTGMVVNGGMVGPWTSFPEGTVFIDVTFRAPVYIGEGSIFINPTFERCCPREYDNPNSEVGEGAVVEGGYLEWVDFDGNAAFKGSSFGPRFSGGGGSTFDRSGQAGGNTGGAAYEGNTGGMVNQTGAQAPFDPCAADPCDPNQTNPGPDGSLDGTTVEGESGPS